MLETHMWDSSDYHVPAAAEQLISHQRNCASALTLTRELCSQSQQTLVY